MATDILFISLTWLAYVYLGYPTILALLAKRTARDDSPECAESPTVSILIAAYNEAASIEKTIRNKLSLEYAPEKLEVIVVSDGSTDGTDSIVSSLSGEFPGRVRLIRQEPRNGKTSALNIAVPVANGDLVVFSDANSIYAPDALIHLVRAFGDPTVGYVTGKMIYTNSDGSIVGDGCTMYMRYENLLRRWEARVGSVVGVDGGIDAVRRGLYRPMRDDQLPDFVLPLSVVDQGYRVVFAERAILREEALQDAAHEYRMRVRVGLRALWALWDMRRLFNPFEHPVFSWQLLSHKLLRYTAFLPQVGALIANAVLIQEHPSFRVLFGAQILFYFLAALGSTTQGRAAIGFLVTGPYYLTLLNLASAHAAMKFLRGDRMKTWQPRGG